MKFASFALVTFALSTVGLTLDGLMPAAAHGAGSLELGSKVGQFCTIEFRDHDRKSAHIMGTLSKVTPDWIVMMRAKRIDVSPDLQKESELWVPAKSVTSVSF